MLFDHHQKRLLLAKFLQFPLKTRLFFKTLCPLFEQLDVQCKSTKMSKHHS